MTTFTYKARQNPKEIITGAIQAQSADEAIQKIMQMGCAPIEVVPQLNVRQQVITKPVFLQGWTGKVPVTVVSMFTRQISDLLEAGVPILRSLKLLANQERHPLFKTILGKMHLFVQDGGTLSASQAMHPQTFSSFYIN